MTGNELSSIFGGGALTPRAEQLLSPTTQRHVRREIEQVQARKFVALAEATARAEVEAAALAFRTARAAAVEHAESQLTSQRMMQTAMLHSQAASLAQSAPTAARHLGALLDGYVTGAINRGSTGL